MEVVTDVVHIRQTIEQARLGKKVVMLGVGNSMRPLLRDGRDYIELRDIRGDERLKKYDIVFYRSYTGAYVLHRIIKVTEDGCRMNGDGNRLVEPMVKRKDIYLKAVGIWRKGKYIRMNGKAYRIYSILWMKLLPVRGILLRIDDCIQKHIRGRQNV